MPRDSEPQLRLIPRPDQHEAHDAVIGGLGAGIRRPLCVEPCAWGKSLLLAMTALTLDMRGWRVLILAHRSELLEQNTGALLRLDPGVDVGLCSASLKADRLDARVVVGGTATIYRRLMRLGRFDAVLLDEAHLLGPGSTSMLAKILGTLGDPPLIGFTATPFRTDSGPLVSAELFETIVHETTIATAMTAGLVPLRTKVPKVGRIDTTGVHVVAGEFHHGELEQAALRGDATEQAVARAVQVADTEDRRSLLFFAVGVVHAHRIGTALRRHGVTTVVITGQTPMDERADAIARFRSGELRALVNCNVLTTGFDARNIDLIAFMRPTVSPVLWVQACGRGMRTFPAKQDCRLLDFGGNLLRHGPIDNVRLRAPGERHNAEAAASRLRFCPKCEEANPVTAIACSACGTSLIPPRTVNVAPVESSASALHGQARWVPVVAMRGGIHQKPGAPPSFRLSFRTPDEGEVSDFLAMEHASNGARWWAASKWRRYSRNRFAAPPTTAREAYARYCRGELPPPRRIRIEREGGFWCVQGVELPP